jgi:hypothetical protein
MGLSHEPLFIICFGPDYGEVYKWVEGGQTHYSNQRPEGLQNVEVIEVFDAPSTASQKRDPSEELERIKDFARQLAEEREARERRRLEEHLDALEASYQELLNEKPQPQEREDEESAYAFPFYLYPHHIPIQPPCGSNFYPCRSKARRPQALPFKPVPQERPPVKRITPREQGASIPQRSILPADRGARGIGKMPPR